MLLSDPASALSRLRLVAIIDANPETWPARERTLRRALAAGLPAVMLRERRGSDESLRPIATHLRELTNESGALLIINRSK